jgi:predicted Rossmann fold flavoprotein
MKTIAIIGAGAAGLMTAVTILEKVLSCHADEGSICPSDADTIKQIPHSSEWQKRKDFQIHIFEKNKTPGNKIIISWGGRCNVTTSITDKKMLATKYTRGWEFIRKAMGKFGPAKTYEWFESHGVPLKTQADMRVFPVSDDGYDVVDVFEQVFAKYRDKISIHYWEWVSEVSVIARNEAIQEQIEEKEFQIQTQKWRYLTDMLVITTWWSAYSHTGSSGDGYAFARVLGHTVTPLWPSLSSFLTRESWTHSLSGLSFENARIWELHWPLLLTHFWLSGPLAFMYSSRIAWDKLDKNTPKTIHLSPLAGIDTDMWDTFLKSEFSLHPKKTITTILSEKLARRFVDGFIAEFFSHISDTYVSSVSKTDRLHIAELLGRGIPITLIERRPGDEFVTAGWVSTDEIDPETMESKIQENLYFAGEILNVDGYTGGFSLQICWSSGYVAGRDIADKL